MRKVWAFGDSWCELKGYTKDYYTLYKDQDRPVINDGWIMQVARNIRSTHTTVYGLAGTSLHFTYKEFNLARSQIEIGDAIIVVLTEVSRRWFFQDRPRAATGWSVDTNITRDEYDAYKKYIVHLDKNPELDKVMLHLFFQSLEAVTKEKNATAIVIAGFDHEAEFINEIRDTYPLIHFADKSLISLDRAEFSNELSEKEVDEVRAFTKDKRHNHLCRSNHNILAKKVTDYILYREPIKITGFQKGIINRNFLQNIEQQKYELFGLHY